jgi:hypothetical protein
VIRNGGGFPSPAGALEMTRYEFAYFGAYRHAVTKTVASWCAARDCTLEITPLLAGVRYRICGPAEIVREAIGTVRSWIRTAV